MLNLSATTMKTFALLTAALGLAVAAGSGCNSPDFDDPATYVWAEKGYVPPKSLLVREFTGDDVIETAPEDGKYFLFDQDEYPATDRTHNPVYSWLIRKGQKIEISPSSNTVIANGMTTNVEMYPNHRYKLFFQKIVYH